MACSDNDLKKKTSAWKIQKNGRSKDQIAIDRSDVILHNKNKYDEDTEKLVIEEE